MGLAKLKLKGERLYTVDEYLNREREAFKRSEYIDGEKFTRYQLFNDTLTDYILVSQDKPQIEHFIKQNDGHWKLFSHIGLDKVCPIDSIECRLELREVYDRIEFSKKTLNFLQEIENITK